MSVKISESDNITMVKLANQSSDPSAPASGFHLLYVKSGGLYLINSAGTIVGPLIDGSGTVAFSADVSPTQITGDQNNYNPTGLATANTLRLSSDASRNITGLAGGTDGRLLLIHNVGAQNIVLKDEDAASTAANRFALTGDFTLLPDAVCLLQYDSTSSRWRLIGGGAGAFIELGEITTPDLPTANRLRIYAADDGSGNTRLYILDSGGYDRLVPNAFVDLVDVPAGYTGYENQAVRVNGFGSGLDFFFRYVNTTSIGNVGTGEDNLRAATLPADFTFAVDGDVVRFVGAGTFAATANNKRLRVKLGATTIFDSGALVTTTAESWHIEGMIIRTGASAEKTLVKFTTSDATIAPQVQYGTAAEDSTTDLTLQFTGEATADNDIVQEMLFVEKV